MSLSPPPKDPHHLQSELDAHRVLLQQVRRDLIHAQITVLELNDAVLAKETEKADAISVLAQLELALEAKITHIVQLDQELNRQITELRRQSAAETAEKLARDQIIQDLVTKLDHANREIGKTHELAGGFLRERDEARMTLAQTNRELSDTSAQLSGTARALAECEQTRVKLETELGAMRRTRSWRWTKPFRTLAGLFG